MAKLQRIAITSEKGGVGKSTLAFNLAGADGNNLVVGELFLHRDGSLSARHRAGGDLAESSI